MSLKNLVDSLCIFCLENIKLNESIDIFTQPRFNCKLISVLSKYVNIQKFTSQYNNTEFRLLRICFDCWERFKQFHDYIEFIDNCHLIKKLSKTVVTTSTDNADSVKSDIEEEKLIKPANKYLSIDSDAENSKNTVSIIKTLSNSSSAMDSESKSFTRFNDQKRIREFFKLNCNLCKLSNFDTILLLRKHYRLVHGNAKLGHLICCSKKLTRHWELLDHINWHTNPDEFKCRKCSKTYTDRVGLKLHMHRHVPLEDRLYICDTCNKSFSLKRHLIQHFTYAHVSDNKKIHKCTQCSIAFGSNSILQAHIRRVHKRTDIHICDICGKICKSKSHYLDHSRSHDVKKQKIQCEQCNAWLKNKNSLLLHRRRAHQQSPENCEHCGNVYPNRYALQGHIKYMHRDEPIHKCVLCGKSFKRTFSLKEHMGSHQGKPNLYKCPDCPKTFNSNSTKHKHRKKFHMTELLRERNNQNSIQEISVH